MKRWVSKIYIPTLPILFSCAFVTSQFNSWLSELEIRSILTPIIVVALFSILIFAIFNLALKNRFKTEIVSSFFLVLFFSFGSINAANWEFYLKIGVFNFGKNSLLYLLNILAFIFIYKKIKNLKNNIHQIRKFLITVGSIALIISVFQICSYSYKRSILGPVKSPLTISSPILINTVDKPDIYFILPEDYSSPSVYKKYFNYDQNNFVNFLKAKGFTVPEKATSNYPKSFESISSMLNMEYLDYLTVFKKSSDYTVVDPLINNNNVMKYLKNYGYKYYQLGSWWNPTKNNPNADDNFTLTDKGNIDIDLFASNIAKSTMIGPVLPILLPKNIIGDTEDDDRERVLYQFDKLGSLVNLPGPKFVFAHIISPHGPYVFDKNCNSISKDETSKNSEVQNYVNQTICINQKIEKTIETILDNSKKPPVIILITDEGAPFIGKEIQTSDSDWKNASNLTLQKKFAILSAMYLPGIKNKVLYDTITPVNIFRVIFNTYFDAKFEMLPDKNYIFQDLKNLYQFTDVTEKVNTLE